MIGLWVAKFVALALKVLGRRGTSLPGKLALKFSPNLLTRLGRQLERCVVITGTNGKTTTSALLAAMMQADGPIIHNTEGANMTQGLVSAFLPHVNWLGRLRRKNALFEIDEATLPLVVSALPIRVAVVTNVFRDQLDRYGELDTTIEKLVQGLEQTDAVLLFNGDDPLARNMGLRLGAKRVLYFGLDRSNVRPTHREQMRDGSFCLQCGTELRYEGFFYGQLGLYQCPTCDFCRPLPDFLGDEDGRSLTIRQGDLPAMRFSLPVRGLFNVYNVLAAVAAARVYGLSSEQIATGLAGFRSPLGRMQVFDTSPSCVLNLIKNPTGCDSVLQAISGERGKKVLCIAINDLAADGRDISWLWDADFELLVDECDLAFCVTSGLRAEDMALRLKYAGVSLDVMHTHPDMDEAITEALRAARDLGVDAVYVLTTYTALYPMAHLLERRQGSHETPTVYRASVS